MKRRDFLKTGIAGWASLAALRTSLYAGAVEEPLRVALIGTGWYGKTDLFHLIQVAPVEVVGLCDVDQHMVAEAAELVSQRQASKKRPPTYGDYRKLLKEQQPEIALIATPDHWHCLPMIEACKAGVDLYVQKPISYDVVEGQAMLAAARKYQRTVQVGLQRRSTPHLLEARDRFVATGKLGRIAYVDIHSYYGSPGDFPPNEKPPEYLDWETYVGPATWRDYNPGIHPRNWRACREFSNGQTGDLCVHFFDVVRVHAATRLATQHFRDRRHPDAQTRHQYQYPRHANRAVRLRETANRLESTQLGTEPGSRLSLGCHALWRQRNSEAERPFLRLYSARQRHAAARGLS